VYIILVLLYSRDDDGPKQLNIHEVPHVSVAEQPERWSIFSRKESITPSDVTIASDDPSLDDYDSTDTFDSTDDDEAYEEMEGNTLKSSRSISDSTIELKNFEDYTKPPSAASNFGSSEGLALIPRSATVRMPLPKLPFESDGNISKSDKRCLPQNTKDFISEIAESVQKSPTTLPRSNKKMFALSQTPKQKINDKGDNYVNTIAQTHKNEASDNDTYEMIDSADDDTYEMIDSAYEDHVNSPLSLSVDFEKNPTGKDATIEELKTVSTQNKNSSGDVTEIMATLQKDFNDFTSNPNTSSSKKSSSVPLATKPKPKQVVKQPHNNFDVNFMGDNLKVSLLRSHGEAASLLADQEVPAYKPDGIQNPAIYDTISQKVDRNSPSELIYDDTISQKVYKGSVNLSSKINYSVVTPQSIPDAIASSSVTTQPIYCNTRVNRKPVSPRPPSIYVKMYRVKPLAQPGSDQTSDTQSEVFSYDYAYHRNLKLRKCGMECNGVPPRNIRRSGYLESVDYVNTYTQCDYVNFDVLKKTLIVSPPRGCFTDKLSDKKTTRKPIPKQRADVRPALPPRNIPRQGHYLSGPLAVPPNYM